MQMCPGCNGPAVRLIKEWQTLTNKYVHAGFDCVLPMQPGAPASEMGVEVSKLRAELLKEKTLRQKRERQLQTIVSYATGQIYLEEIEEHVEPNVDECCNWHDSTCASAVINCCIKCPSFPTKLAETCRASGLADTGAVDKRTGPESPGVHLDA